MPYSGHDFVNQTIRYVEENYSVGNSILDIGAGAGKFGELLSKSFEVDGVEIHQPYIQEFELEKKYNKVLNGNCLDISKKMFRGYDLIFMWKTLEHLSYAESRALINKIKSASVDFIFSVPYMLKQGVCHGNKHEIHKQDDLHLKLVKHRYPEFKTLFTSDHHGVFIWKAL